MGCGLQDPLVCEIQYSDGMLACQPMSNREKYRPGAQGSADPLDIFDTSRNATTRAFESQYARTFYSLMPEDSEAASSMIYECSDRCPEQELSDIYHQDVIG